jgi:cyclophilin family peptidyl-prolyl cis-trans isomerase
MNIAEAIDMLLQIFRWLALGLLVGIFAAPNFARAACNVTGVDPSNDVAELETSLGTVCIELFTTDAPLHVANFLYYANNSLLVGTFFHRSVPGFVLQGGGFTVGPLDFEVVPPDNGTVTNEPCTLDTPAPPPAVPGTMICSVRGNERGTVALAKTGGDPDSGTTNFFFNLIDNRANLDNQNGGFTVFGRVLGDDMDVIDAIEALTISSDDDVAWLESLVFPSGLGAPLQQPPFYGTTYGCWDPSLQATVLDTPSLPGLAAVVDPDIATIPYTVSVGCGTPTSLATFFETPGPPQCPDVSRIAVDTTGPRSLLFPSGSASFVELTCEQLNDSLTERALWQGDFFDDFRSQLVEIETVTVPEPGVVLSWLVAGPMLFAMAKRRRR